MVLIIPPTNSIIQRTKESFANEIPEMIEHIIPKTNITFAVICNFLPTLSN